MVEITFPPEFKIGNVFTMEIEHLDWANIEYGFRMDGPSQFDKGHRFNPEFVLLDPYARVIGGREHWGAPSVPRSIYQHRARICCHDFDWEGDRHPKIPIEDLFIYEMHVRGFTQHPSSKVKNPGTFEAVHEKIPYLRELGINCVELMPICEFDECEVTRRNPYTGAQLKNFWGYNSIGFFAPKAGYAISDSPCREFKELVKALHKNGIEVFLDVVFNHTGEGDSNGATISFRGIDNKTYYMLGPEGEYLNFSGTGNTTNCNNPVVRNMVIECLRHWVVEYHIDGFRFDLASVLGRDQDGHPLSNPPLIEALAYDPILADCKLIAEAWDAGGLYQVGSFPSYDRWAEWNGKYRDTVRQFLRGDENVVGDMVARLLGSPDLYHERGHCASINFITSHDGFTLADLFAYNYKHNLANGEENRDGCDENFSYNFGCEGPTSDSGINALRRKQIKNGVALLMLSHGVPMILSGDEVGHSKNGNNNTYCHDNELNWFNWDLRSENSDLFDFFRKCIAFRKNHAVFHSQSALKIFEREVRNVHFRDPQAFDSEILEERFGISWHGVEVDRPDWAEYARMLAFVLHSRQLKTRPDYDIYVAANMYWEKQLFELPPPPEGQRWHLFVDTGTWPDCHEPGEELLLRNQYNYLVKNRSTVILVSK